MAVVRADRIDAIEIAEAISNRIGSYVHNEFIEFVAVTGDKVLCWYMNSGGEGPSFAIEIIRQGGEWQLELTQLPPGTEHIYETS